MDEPLKYQSYPQKVKLFIWDTHRKQFPHYLNSIEYAMQLGGFGAPKLPKLAVSITLLSISILLSGCGPPTYVLTSLLFCPGGVFLFLIGLGIFLFSTRKDALKVEGAYIISVGLLFMLSFCVPLAAVLFIPDFGINVYTIVLLCSLAAGLVFTGATLLLRSYNIVLVKPEFAGFFGFLLYFLITFGYFLTASELEKVYLRFYSSVENAMLWGQLPYVSFILAPLSILIWWLIDSLLKRKPWSPSIVIYRNLLLLWGFLITSIVLTAIISGQTIATLMPRSLPTERVMKDYIALYILFSDVREIFFFNSCHDLLVAVFITVGMVSINRNSELFRARNTIAMGGVVVAVITVIIPFYLGQKETVDHIVNSLGGTYVEQATYRDELIQLRPLYPSLVSFRNLLVSLAAGGILVFVLNLRRDTLVFNEVIGGDKITVGNITESKAVSIGKEISTNINDSL